MTGRSHRTPPADLLRAVRQYSVVQNPAFITRERFPNGPRPALVSTAAPLQSCEICQIPYWNARKGCMWKDPPNFGISSWFPRFQIRRLPSQVGLRCPGSKYHDSVTVTTVQPRLRPVRVPTHWGSGGRLLLRPQGAAGASRLPGSGSVFPLRFYCKKLAEAPTRDS